MRAWKHRTRTAWPGAASLGVLLAVMISGCVVLPEPYVPKAGLVPKTVYCNDHTGHLPGATPWILGGNCTCTPTEELMAKLHADDICTGIGAESLQAEYRAKGIALRGATHNWCNGMCPAGPHVVLGGKCMCPPTPGTQYYEKIVTGAGAVRRNGATTMNQP